ncbi:phosphoribosylformylglycinamidine synthase [Nitrosomonas supralitoralis]|uniref:Phosphoribosylformylglycinamidine synthase n=1 Tax=Nitrosomonas supralitoralis TaxID=2116706 RepID=A0A2P7NVF1_9PROT|nr:phosphoribosylformylglycinamidine synthase [Nitrosomonas supralitoralis]PSJ17447.1 phosphoribosylformylglycinamidine synthase [Nitrosomonas supralitoralis]
MLQFCGGRALSPFRLEKLLKEIRTLNLPVTAIHSEYWHFCSVTRSLYDNELSVLRKILNHDQVQESVRHSGEMFLVLPRPGTISPWSTKATDIAQHCGLAVTERIERGIVHYIQCGAELSSDDKARLVPLLHDRMTEAVFASLDDAAKLFEHFPSKPLGTIDVMYGGIKALLQANQDMGLALSPDEIEYLLHHFQRIHRNPTDVELMMFAQANSEHCRHKIFNADWIVDGKPQDKSLFAMIRNTHQSHPQGTLVAYTDNASVIEGAKINRFYPDSQRAYGYAEERTHVLMKVETHNHPTAISPFPGAATGVGGEIRDEGATGRGAKPKAGLCGFSVSNLTIPGFVQPWEYDGADNQSVYGKPGRIASALQIMLEGPIGGAGFNNEFGRPNLAGYFRTFEERLAGEMRGYHKPIMLAGGIGQISDLHVRKEKFPAGALLIQLGGPSMLIGLGGGAASSMDTGSNTEALDFDSVQRGNPEMQRRAQEVIDRCWQLQRGGVENPILFIHDVGAGGLSNAFPELVHDSGRGGRFNLRDVPSEETSLSPMQIWSNEAQERYVLAIKPESLVLFQSICERERCPFAVVGEATSDEQLVVTDPQSSTPPVDMPLPVLLGKPPRMTRDVAHKYRILPTLDWQGVNLTEAVYRVLRLPAVADKTFLIAIGDRSVGGLSARDQMIGPWQIPVADVAVTSMGYQTYLGEAFAIGERTPLALIDFKAAARMAVGEAITNIAAASIGKIEKIKLSANWMAAAGHAGEDAGLFDAVHTVGMDLCPQLGISIPVGKDSMSMKTVWEESGLRKEVTAPLSLIITAFATVMDVRKTLTPELRTDCGDTELVLIDLGRGQNRLGGSALAQVYKQVGNVAPNIDGETGAQHLKSFFKAIQQLNDMDKLLAYHDRSDGGLFVTLCEMAFAGHTGLTVNLDQLCFDPHSCDIDGSELQPEQLSGRFLERLLTVLFNEELGAVIQIEVAQRQEVLQVLTEAGLRDVSFLIGQLNGTDEVRLMRNNKPVLAEKRVDLQRAWSETTYQMQKLRDNPNCAQQEYDRLLDITDPGLQVRLSYDVDDDIAAPFVQTGMRPRLAILREQGVNGHMEMAAAFDRAGFTPIDVHMSDILSGQLSLSDFMGLIACGGFSYGDVLGAGEGWAKSILFNPRAREEFEAFFQRSDTFALGVCNGCQMMSNLHEIIPGAERWPRFTRNLSEQFEARFVMVEIQRGPSLFFDGMAGSRMPITVAHGEGKVEFCSGVSDDVASLVTMRFVDNHGQVTEQYPYNPSGSLQGITGLTTPDGRFNVLMPHPERVFRVTQHSWYPDARSALVEDGPWMRLFRNARKWIG